MSVCVYGGEGVRILMQEYLFLRAGSYICIAVCAWACKDLDFLEEKGDSGLEQDQAEPPFSSGP